MLKLEDLEKIELASETIYLNTRSQTRDTPPR
jgi:hypothetical protein